MKTYLNWTALCFLCLFLLASCKKDKVITEEIELSGIASITGNILGSAGNTTIKLYLRLADGQPDSTNLLDQTSLTGPGTFEFSNLLAGEYVLKALVDPGYIFTYGTDDTPDPDGIGDPLFPELIPVDLTVEEVDADNNFAIESPNTSNITGQVLEDTNGDLIGDLGLEDHRIELYYRNSDGVPTSPDGTPLDFDYSDENGQFSFSDMPPGEYVIYHIGTGDYPYECLSGSDLTPEPGEPTIHPQCFFIQVDIQESISQDYDNTFVIKKL